MQIFILNQLPDLYKVLDPWDWHTSTGEPSKQFMQPNDNNYEASPNDPHRFAEGECKGWRVLSGPRVV